MREILKYSNLDKINESFETIKLFELPFKCRLYVSNLLLIAVKIDRDQNIVSLLFLKREKAKNIYFLFCFRMLVFTRTFFNH